MGPIKFSYANSFIASVDFAEQYKNRDDFNCLFAKEVRQHIACVVVGMQRTGIE